MEIIIYISQRENALSNVMKLWKWKHGVNLELSGSKSVLLKTTPQSRQVHNYPSTFYYHYY